MRTLSKCMPLRDYMLPAVAKCPLNTTGLVTEVGEEGTFAGGTSAIGVLIFGLSLGKCFGNDVFANAAHSMKSAHMALFVIPSLNLQAV